MYKVKTTSKKLSTSSKIIKKKFPYKMVRVTTKSTVTDDKANIKLLLDARKIRPFIRVPFTKSRKDIKT